MANKTGLYFETQDSPYCYELSFFKAQMRSYELDEMTVYEAVKDPQTGFFFCHHFGEIGAKGEDTCGRMCQGYEPRNGKSGCCKHYSGNMYTHGDEVTIKLF